MVNKYFLIGNAPRIKEEDDRSKIWVILPQTLHPGWCNMFLLLFYTFCIYIAFLNIQFVVFLYYLWTMYLALHYLDSAHLYLWTRKIFFSWNVWGSKYYMSLLPSDHVFTYKMKSSWKPNLIGYYLMFHVRHIYSTKVLFEWNPIQWFR